MFGYEALLFGSVAVRLTVAFVTANGPHERQVICPPGIDQGGDELVHHLFSVMWRGSNSQAFVTTCYCGVVDGLHVDVVILHQVVRNFRGFLWIANLKVGK